MAKASQEKIVFVFQIRVQAQDSTAKVPLLIMEDQRKWIGIFFTLSKREWMSYAVPTWWKKKMLSQE